MASFFASLATATAWAVILGVGSGHTIKQLQNVRTISAQHHCDTIWSAAAAKQLQSTCQDNN